MPSGALYFCVIYSSSIFLKYYTPHPLPPPHTHRYSRPPTPPFIPSTQGDRQGRAAGHRTHIYYRTHDTPKTCIHRGVTSSPPSTLPPYALYYQLFTLELFYEVWSCFDVLYQCGNNVREMIVTEVARYNFCQDKKCCLGFFLSLFVRGKCYRKSISFGQEIWVEFFFMQFFLRFRQVKIKLQGKSYRNRLHFGKERKVKERKTSHGSVKYVKRLKAARPIIVLFLKMKIY